MSPPVAEPVIVTKTVSLEIQKPTNLASIFAKAPEVIEAAVQKEEKVAEKPKANLFGGLASAMKSSGFGTGENSFQFR